MKNPARGKKRASAATSKGKSVGKKSKTAEPRQWWLAPLAVAIVIAAFAWTYYPVARVQYRETRERARLQAELESIRARNTRLSTAVERLKTPEGVEDYARSQLGMVRKGENVVVVVDGENTSTPQYAMAAPGVSRIDSDETTDAVAGPWTAFLDVVFGVQ